MNNELNTQTQTPEKLSYLDRVMRDLASLYQCRGYRQYRMSKFEEYDLYAGNKDFLAAEEVITFTDYSGKLMALKPDVTLSIVRSCRPAVPYVHKVYYDENVYRREKNTRTVKEIRQLGLEAIGPIGRFERSEVLALAARSMKAISPDAVLVLSSPDLIAEEIGKLGSDTETASAILRFLGEKNLPALKALAETAPALEGNPAFSVLCFLTTLSGRPDEVIPQLRDLGCSAAAVRELETLSGDLAAIGLGDSLLLDFSLAADMNYYNGIIFKGYVPGVPDSVLSGGQYDRLMKKMGSVNRAIGFAVSPGVLDHLCAERPFDVDLLLLFDPADTDSLPAVMEELTASGLSVQAQKAVPEGLRYARLARLSGKEVRYE